MADRQSPWRFARNAAANWITFVFAAVVSFFLSPYVVAHLGATQYGVWSLIAGLVGYLGLLDLGIRQAVNRFVAAHRGAGAHRDGSLIVSAALQLFGFLGIAAIALAGLLAWLAPIAFNIPADFAGDARLVLVLGGATVAVTLVAGVAGGVITGLERFDIHCGLEIFVTAVRTLAIIMALREGYGLVALAVIQLSASLLNCVVFWIVARRLYPELRIRPLARLASQMRTILAFSAWLTVIYALDQVIYYGNTAIIGAFLPIEAVTYFVIAGSLCVYAKSMPKSLSFLMTPRVSILTSRGSSRVGDEIVSVAKIATLVSAPIAITFLLRGESFIALWMGAEYGPLSGDVLAILALVVWLDASRSVVTHSLMGMAKHRMVVPGVVAEAACTLALSVALVHRYGIVGVALGTVIPHVLASFAWIPHCLEKAAGVPMNLFRREAVLLPTLACVPFALATAAFERFMPAHNLAVFFLQCILTLPLVLMAAWHVCLSRAQQAHVKSEMRTMY